MATGRTNAFDLKPFSKKQKQLVYWWDPDSPVSDNDLVIAHGSIRSGKTIAMIMSFVLWSQETFENEAFIMAGKSIGALNRNVVRPMLQLLETMGITYKINRSENFLTIGSNTYYMFGANNEKSQDLIQGLTAAGLYGDEVTLFPRSFVDQAMSRCSVENSRIFFNCNPGSPHHFIKTDFIDDKLNKKVFAPKFSLDDNLTLSEKIKDRYRRMYSGVFYQRYVLGEWVLAEGIIYDMFDEKLNTYEALPKPRHRPYLQVIGVDYGSQNPTVFLKAYIDGDRVFIDDEYYFCGRDEHWTKTDSQYASDLEDFIDKPLKTFVDPSAASFIAECRMRRMNIVQADNAVLDGIRTVAAMMEKGLIKINKRCVNTLKELGEYAWDQKAQEKGLDEPMKINDHCADALRYLVYSHFKNKPMFKTTVEAIPDKFGF